MGGLGFDSNEGLAVTQPAAWNSNGLLWFGRCLSGLAGALCVAISVAASSLFLPHQSLWNDEATQLAGLTLNPIEVTKWLAGTVDYDFGVPDDRMPPLSYWSGWAWSKVFGQGERPMRWFGVACVAMATGIVFAAANRAWGRTAGVIAALLLGTSPNVIVQSVEIRAYPMLILASAGIFACLIGYADGPIESRRKWLAGMLACGIAGMYTHFFGLAALGGAFVAALLLARARRESIVPILAAGAVAGVAALGLGPFVFASASLSQGAAGPADGKVIGLVRLVYRLFSHPAMSVSQVAVGLSALGFVLGIACGLAYKHRSRLSATGLALALASGGAVVALAHLSQSSFDAANPSYNVWMLPALALLMSSGLAANARPVRVTALAGIIMTLVANTYADGQLAVRGDTFAHTPHRQIAALILRSGPQQVAVIHDGDTDQAWHIYSPIRYEFGGAVRQFSFNNGEQDATGVRVRDYPGRKTEINPTDLPFNELIVLRSEKRRAKDVASQIHHGIVPLGDGPVSRALLASGVWDRVEQATYPAFVIAEVDVFRKVAHH